MIETILRTKKELVYYNSYNISDRLLKVTNGDMFVAFNRKKDQFELHSCFSFKKSRQADSMNANPDQKLLNDWIVKDVKAKDTRKFLEEFMDRDVYIDQIADEAEERWDNSFLESGMNEIRNLLGGL